MKNNADREIADLTRNIQGCQMRMNDIFMAMGKQYYAVHGENPEPEFAQMVNDMKTVLGQIKQMDTRIKFLRGIVVCDKCGTDNSVNSVFCCACGTRLPHTFNDGANRCVNCGNIINPGQKFCGVCGAVVGQQPAPAPQPTPEPVQQPTPEPVQEPQPIQEPVTVPQPETVTEPITAQPEAQTEAAASVEQAAPEPMVYTAPEPEKRFCANCGAEVTESDAVFCANCGAKI